MCGGVIFSHQGQDFRLFFPNPKAVVPVLQKGAGTLLLPWGRRKAQLGVLPPGGWARLESIYDGRWDRYFPTPVKLPILQFMEKDIEGVSRWYELSPGQWIQGLVAREKYEQRVYIVTVEPDFRDAVHDRWPRIMN